MKVLIFGAKSIALGVCEAVRVLYPDTNVMGFLVSSLPGFWQGFRYMRLEVWRSG